MLDLKSSSPYINSIRLQKENNNVILGRNKDTFSPIDERSVSRHHCRILLDDDMWTIEDLQSTHGTYINEYKLPSQAVPINQGDEIRLGKICFTVTRISEADPQPRQDNFLDRLCGSCDKSDELCF